MKPVSCSHYLAIVNLRSLVHWKIIKFPFPWISYFLIQTNLSVVLFNDIFSTYKISWKLVCINTRKLITIRNQWNESSGFCEVYSGFSFSQLVRVVEPICCVNTVLLTPGKQKNSGTVQSQLISYNCMVWEKLHEASYSKLYLHFTYLFLV